MEKKEPRLEGAAKLSPSFRWWPTFADLLTAYLKAVATSNKKEQESARGKLYAHTQTWGRLFKNDKGALSTQATKAMAAHCGVLISMIDSVGSDQLEDLSWFDKAVDTNVQTQVEILNLWRPSFPHRSYRTLVQSQTSALARAILAVMDEDPKTFGEEQKIRQSDAMALGALCAEWL